MSHPLAASIAAVRRELAALERLPAPADAAALHTASRLLRRAAEAVASAGLAVAPRVP